MNFRFFFNKTKKAATLLCPVFLFISLLFSACGEQPTFSTFEDVPNEQWTYEDTLQIEVKGDQLAGKKPTLMIRHADDYAFQNLWLKIAVDSSAFKRQEFTLGNGQGFWLGKKGGGLYTLETELEEFELPSDSTKISILQNMRENPLEGIQSVGVKVE